MARQTGTRTLSPEQLAQIKAEMERDIRAQIKAEMDGAQSPATRTMAEPSVDEDSLDPNRVITVYRINQQVMPATATEGMIQPPFTLRDDTYATSVGKMLDADVLRRLKERNAEQGGVLQEVIRVPASEWNDALLKAAVQ